MHLCRPPGKSVSRKGRNSLEEIHRTHFAQKAGTDAVEDAGDKEAREFLRTPSRRSHRLAPAQRLRTCAAGAVNSGWPPTWPPPNKPDPVTRRQVAGNLILATSICKHFTILPMSAAADTARCSGSPTVGGHKRDLTTGNTIGLECARPPIIASERKCCGECVGALGPSPRGA